MDMFETMRHANGVGLAANQVGLNEKIFVIDVSVVEGYENIKPVAMINPQILDESDETIVIEEGCLSLPNLRVDIERPKIVKVRYLDTDEKEQEIEADEFFARVILHEYDHLIGKMMPDRVEYSIRKKLKDELDDIRNRKVKVDYPITEK
jgi:peptide deformylase